MKVLYLNPGASMGGAETSLLELLSAVRTLHPNWDLHLLLGEDGPLKDLATKLGCHCQVLPLPANLARAGDSALRSSANRGSALLQLCRALLDVPSYARSFRRTVHAIHPDIVHATGLKMQVLAAALRLESPVIWHIHDYVSWRPVARHLLRLLSGGCRLALVNSQSVEKDLLLSCPSLASTRVVYNAVDAPSLSASQPLNLDRLAGFEAAPSGTLKIGLVATYARWKGHESFLKALSLLPRELPWRAFVVGGPIYKTGGSQFSHEELQTKINDLGLGDRVGLTGFIADRGAVMRSLDIVIHASTKPEPFGMVVIEAMACRRPVVVSLAGGVAELCEDGVTALCHTPGDSVTLAKRMEQLLHNCELRHSLAERAFAWVTEQFSRDRLSRQLSLAYRDLVGERG